MSGLAYNNVGYNEAAYNAAEVIEDEVAPTSLLTFDSYNCDDRVNMTISKILFNSGHKRDIDQYVIPRANGIRVANVNEREKIIRAIGKADATDVDAMESLIDDMKKNLRGKRKKLVTCWGGKTRVFEHATLINMDSIFSREHYHIDMVPFELQFLCEEFATDWAYEQWGDEITTEEDTLVAQGRGTTEGKPIIIVVFSAASGVTEITVQIDENGNKIGYNAGALNAGDALVFDCENEIVTLNDVPVNFTGYFPEMVLDDNTFRFTTNGASRTYRATVKSKHAYQ